MPSGKTHTFFNVALLIIITTAIYKMHTFNLNTAIFIGGLMFGTLLLSPDLDLSYSSVTGRWGILRILWFPYSLLFKHRGFSHHIIIGLLSRLLYLAILLALLFLFIPFNIPKATYLLIFCGGILVADFMHIALDKIF